MRLIQECVPYAWTPVTARETKRPARPSGAKPGPGARGPVASACPQPRAAEDTASRRGVLARGVEHDVKPRKRPSDPRRGAVREITCHVLQKRLRFEAR